MTPNALNMPTYEEVVSLSNGELMNRMKHITGQINEAILRSQGTTELAHIYKVYEEEWFKRLAFAWHKSPKSTPYRPATDSRIDRDD